MPMYPLSGMVLLIRKPSFLMEVIQTWEHILVNYECLYVLSSCYWTMHYPWWQYQLLILSIAAKLDVTLTTPYPGTGTSRTCLSRSSPSTIRDRDSGMEARQHKTRQKKIIHNIMQMKWLIWKTYFGTRAWLKRPNHFNTRKHKGQNVDVPLYRCH